MGFLKKLFGGGDSSSSGRGDSDGFFLYVQCDHCQKKVRLRLNKRYDLNHTGDGYVWHKTIVDSRCFRPMAAVVHFDARLNPSKQEIEGGRFISRAEFEEAEVSKPTESKEIDG
jgi:hypothetical protein